MLDAFTWTLILLPLAAYFVVIGIYSMRRRPFFVSGARDLFSLGLAVFGLMMVGPFRLFFPQATFNLIGGSVWIGIALLYLLILTLISLGQRPRIVVHSAFGFDVRSYVQQQLGMLDSDATWSGDAFTSEKLQIAGVVEHQSPPTIAQIVAHSRRQSLSGWIRLQNQLNLASSQLESRRKPLSIWLVVGLMMLLVSTFIVVYDNKQIVESMRETFRF